MMADASKSVADRVALVLAAAVVIVLYMAFLMLLGKSSVFAYSLALLTLVAWPVVAPFAARRLMKEQVYWPLFLSWGLYVLVLAYVLGHRLPFPHLVNYINRHSMVLIGTFYALSVEAHHYLTKKRYKVEETSPEENMEPSSIT